MEKGFGILFLGVSLVLLFSGITSITGGVINNYLRGGFAYKHIFGFVLLLISILILSSRKDLDAIIIPSAGYGKKDLERTKTAEKAYEEKGTKYFLISGAIDRDQKDNLSEKSPILTIYKELRKYGIKPSQIKIEGKSKDTLENAIYSLRKLKNAKKIGIVSGHTHLDRFKLIIEKAKQENLVPKDVKIDYLPTSETTKEKIYGLLGLLREKYRLKDGIKKAQENKTGYIGNLIKKILTH